MMGHINQPNVFNNFYLLKFCLFVLCSLKNFDFSFSTHIACRLLPLNKNLAKMSRMRPIFVIFKREIRALLFMLLSIFSCVFFGY